MAPNDLLKVKLNSGQQLFWQIQVIHAEAANQEALVEVIPLSQLMDTRVMSARQALIPYKLVLAGIEGGTIVHYSPLGSVESGNLRHMQQEARIHALEARELRAHLHEIHQLLGLASSSATPPTPSSVIQRIVDLKKALLAADRFIKKMLGKSSQP
ncbi:MAG: hypothetical protein OEW58_01365 [Gammaproteobacteria bacterium]|nr:hypothetical protein [Gammaproteobacteria bacterium]